MSAPWKDSWFASAGPARRDIWRGVEAQHVVATLRLVDSVREQELLEDILEGTKPSAPQAAPKLHFLLFTPFRYRSPQPSRFRAANAPGVFYGADEPATVAAELAHWRWKFLMDSEGLRARELESVHTFFMARFSGVELDITAGPWKKLRSTWRDPADYSACQQLAAAVRGREQAPEGIRYESARREGGMCSAVFEPSSLSMPKPNAQQTWSCKTTAGRVIWAHDGELMEFMPG